MTLRIILIQLRQTTTDQEEEAREAIAKYVRDLNKEIGTALNEIVGFRQKVAIVADQSIREVDKEMTHVRESFSTFVSQSNEVFSQVLKEVGIEFQTAMYDLTNKIRQIDVPTEVITTKLGTATESIVTELNGVRSSLGAGSHGLVTELDRVRSSLAAGSHGLVTELDGVRSSLAAGSHGLVTALDEVRSSLAAGSKEVEQSLNDSVLVVGRAMRESDEMLRSVASAHQKMAEAATVTGEAATGAQRFMENVRQTGIAMEQLNGRAADLGRVMSGVVAQLEARGEIHRSEIDQAKQLLRSVVTDIQSNGEAFTAAVVESAKDLRNAVRNVGS
jgi:uncharacterized phage infection (PIP) family protein YhgE